jgi:hypothetical protein
LQDAAKEANTQATGLIGGARADFQPYMNAGTGALAQLPGLANQPGLAGKFGPVESSQFAPIRGGMTLAQLSARK